MSTTAVAERREVIQSGAPFLLPVPVSRGAVAVVDQAPTASPTRQRIDAAVDTIDRFDALVESAYANRVAQHSNAVERWLMRHAKPIEYGTMAVMCLSGAAYASALVFDFHPLSLIGGMLGMLGGGILHRAPECINKNKRAEREPLSTEEVEPLCQALRDMDQDALAGVSAHREVWMGDAVSDGRLTPPAGSAIDAASVPASDVTTDVQRRAGKAAELIRQPGRPDEGAWLTAVKVLLTECAADEGAEVAATVREKFFSGETCVLAISSQAQHDLHRLLEGPSKPQG